MITPLVFVIVFVLLSLGGYILWAMQQKLDSMAEGHANLSKKVRDGEHAIIENFSIVEKNFRKLENEIEKVAKAEPKAKEALKAINRLQRERGE